MSSKKKATKKVAKKVKLRPFRICYNLMADCDIFQDQSPSEMSQLSHLEELFEEAFDAPDYQKWRDEIYRRTDLSDDMRWELESFEDQLERLLNIRDNLLKQGLIDAPKS